MSLSPVAARASYDLWRSRERDALRLWRSRQQRLDQDDPRRGAAFHAYRHAQAMRKKRAREIARLPATHMDAAGRAALIREEGVRRFAYNDSAGHATFGVGHLLHLGPVTAADRARWGTSARPLSMKVVDTVLQADLVKYERAVRDALHGVAGVTQAMLNACVSLAFNIGTGGFATSSVVKHLRAGHKAAAADAFLLWDHPRELRGRRERERVMFLTPG
jgi:GH24 family phage-related lysozyme (muramidase)